MSFYNPHRRLLLSVVVAIGFGSLYVLFRAVTSPFLDVERAKQKVSAPTQLEIVSPDVREDAAKYFPDHPWVAKARTHFRDHGRYLFCKEFKLADDSHSIVVTPVAMLWRSAKDDVPVTIVADSARLTRSSRFSIEDSELGRITSGSISGNVQVRGPRGLHIKAGMFRLEQSTMRLWSSEQVDFAWDGHRGVAHSGVEIHLSSADDILENVTDVSKVLLLGRVVCNLVVPGARIADESLKVNISAARRFVFDVTTRTGTFAGLPAAGARSRPQQGNARGLVRHEEVLVSRLNTDGSVDELICPELRLTLRSAADPQSGGPVEDSMQLEHVQAWGRSVEFHSPQQDVHVFGNDFRYAVDQRQIDIQNITHDFSEVQKYVDVHQGESRLKVPHIRVLHTAAGELQRLECNKQGAFRGVSKADEGEGENGPKPPPSVFGARWGEGLVLQVSPDGRTQHVTIDGGATVADITQNMKLSAQRIAVKLRKEEGPLPVLPTESKLSDVSPAAKFFENLKPEFIMASGGVVLESPEGSGRLRETMTVRFHEQSPAVPIRNVSSQQVEAADDPDAPDARDDSAGSFSFLADTADATVVIDANATRRRMPPYAVWLKGAVEVMRRSVDRQNDFTATGNQLQVTAYAATERTIQLFGDPAKVVSAAQNLEGPRIDLNELDGNAEVVGSGRIRFVTKKGFDGKDLPEPMPLDIYWSDHMKFRKRSADFVGKTRVVMSDGKTQDIEMTCAGLTVYFSKDVSLNSQEEGAFEAVVLSPDADDADNGPIERLECHNRVEVKIDQYESGSVVGRHHAVFADLKANLITGDFTALGPGHLESVSPDKDGRLQGSSPVTVRPNTPSQTKDTVFVYLKTEFVGGVTGNIDGREATLSHNVVALMVPVRRVDEKMNLQELPTEQLPERAGILQADTLTMGAIWSADGVATSFSLVGRRNARLESRSISASADVITYDHAKEQFIMRAEGENSVTVHHRSGPAGQFNRSSGNRFEYYRKTNELKADRIRGVNLTQ